MSDMPCCRGDAQGEPPDRPDPVTPPAGAVTRFAGTSGPAELKEECGHWSRKPMGELITCPFCVSSGLATTTLRLPPGAAGPLACALDIHGPGRGGLPPVSCAPRRATRIEPPPGHGFISPLRRRNDHGLESRPLAVCWIGAVVGRALRYPATPPGSVTSFRSSASSPRRPGVHQVAEAVGNGVELVLDA